MAALIVLFERGPTRGEAEDALRRAGLSVAGGEAGIGIVSAEGEALLELTPHRVQGDALEEALVHTTWAQAGDAVDRHLSYARLLPASLEDDSALLERLQARTRMAGPLLRLPGALALFDEAGGVLTAARDAANRALALDAPRPTPPLDLWVGLRTFEVADARGWFLDTLGMGQLGLPDLEAYAGEGGATAEVAAWLRNVSLYLVQEDARARLRHGDTLDGPDEQPWLTVEDVATVEPNRPVLRFTPIPHGAR